MADSQHFELIYQSFSVKHLIQADLERILEESYSRNVEFQISGCLIYHNRMFIQVLEGKEEHVLQLMDNIRKDDRNKDVQVIHQGKIKERGFLGWRMSFIHTDNISLKRKGGFSTFLESDFEPNHINDFKTLSKSILISLKKTLVLNK